MLLSLMSILASRDLNKTKTHTVLEYDEIVPHQDDDSTKGAAAGRARYRYRWLARHLDLIVVASKRYRAVPSACQKKEKRQCIF